MVGGRFEGWGAVKQRADTAGRGRLLDAWQAPDEKVGGAIGCLATTFTFQAAFFEEQCLARFLGMATDPQEHGAAAYLIEREEHLAEVYAGVLIDRRHAQTAERSLRWDALPARVRGAAMHAKVSLLAWSECVRLIIASANLTEVAHRKNLEVFSALDFRDGGEPPLSELSKTLDFLDDLLILTPDGPARERAASFLQRVRRQTSGWHERRQQRSEPRVTVVFGGRFKGREVSVLRSLREKVWPDSSPPRRAWVLSPFFDRETDGSANEAAQALRGLLARRAGYEVTFDVASAVETDGLRRIYAPQSLRRTLPGAVFYAVKTEEDKEQRPLHAKSLWLENEQRAVYLVGSSNFTCAGLGIGAGAWNAEANIAYVARDATSYNALLDVYPPSEAIDDFENVVWEPIFDLDAEPSDAVPPLPAAFADAVFMPETDGGVLFLSFEGEPPARWQVHLADADEADALYDSDRWAADRKALRLSIRVLNIRPPSSLAVNWLDKKGVERRALWLVNVSDPGALPPPDELRDLSLETLLDVLTMSRPLYEAVVRALQKSTQQRQGEGNALRDLDPHARVRTETFLLQRTRRVARALEQLHARLERPVHSREALRWRLRGPVGPLALMRAIEREERPAGETAFLFAEIALTLNRVKPARAPGALSPRVVRDELRGAILELRDASAERLRDVPHDLRDYVERAFQDML
jgi:hypothetical protein